MKKKILLTLGLLSLLPICSCTFEENINSENNNLYSESSKVSNESNSSIVSSISSSEILTNTISNWAKLSSYLEKVPVPASKYGQSFELDKSYENKTLGTYEGVVTVAFNSSSTTAFNDYVSKVKNYGYNKNQTSYANLMYQASNSNLTYEVCVSYGNSRLGIQIRKL